MSFMRLRMLATPVPSLRTLDGSKLRPLSSTSRCSLRFSSVTGEPLDFQVVLAEVENPSLKNLLVQLDEVAARKLAKANLDPASRMRSVIRHFQQHHVQRQLKETETKLEQKHFNPEEEIDVLQNMIQAKRRQQGLLS